MVDKHAQPDTAGRQGKGLAGVCSCCQTGRRRCKSHKQREITCLSLPDILPSSWKAGVLHPVLLRTKVCCMRAGAA